MVKKKRFKRNMTKFWSLWALLFAVMFIVFTIGNSIASVYAPIINTTLNVTTTEIRGKDDSVTQSGYAFTQEGEQQLHDDNVALTQQIMQEGATLVKNNNNALPLASGNSVSIFGIAQIAYLDLADALEADGLTVNRDLYNTYVTLSEEKQPVKGTSANEIAWDQVSSVAGSGDAAVVVLGRTAGEGADCVYTKDGDYLALSADEQTLLQQLTTLKQNGTFQKLIVVIATSNSIDSAYLQDGNALGIDVDSVVWVAQSSGYTAEVIQRLADVLCAKDGLDFSGRLVDTMYVDNQAMPEMANVGAMNVNTSQVSTDVLQEVMAKQGEWAGAQGNYWRTSVTYAEGIYHSYRYYETRYEDYILNGDAHGAYTNWTYDGYVAAPFGTGLHYNNAISYENFSVTPNDAEGTFDLSVTVKNDGNTDVQHSVLAYMQTPYSDRDQSLGIEEGSIKLVGYTKVAVPAHSTAVATISVDQTEMATYDEYDAKTYIRDGGTYYLTVGDSVHDAMNNILADKVTGNEEAAARMTELGETGNASLVWKQDYTFDAQVFSTSDITDFEITNQFDSWDLNKDETAQSAGNSVVYLSRQDWVGTFPKAVSVQYNDAMVLQATPQTYEPDEDLIASTEMPLLDQDYGEDKVTLPELIGLDYDDPTWNTFLSQLSVQQLVDNVSIQTGTAIDEFVVPATLDRDGPTGVGSTTANGIEPVSAVSEDLRAATFNAQLLEQIGRQLFGENMVHSAGDDMVGWWGPGVNIHRTPYGGRNYSYYSEDGYVTGMAAAYETKGCQSVGGRVIAKHYLLNDGETNRHGIATWANEQTIREVYLPAFQLAAEYGGLDSVMTSFNRGGMIWTGQDANLLQNVLRGELGMQGMVITDMYETDYEDAVDGLIGGNTRWLCTSVNPNVIEPIQERIDAGDTVFMNALVEAVHHNLWNVVNSHAMDGFGPETEIVTLTPWWQTALYAVMAVTAVLTVACIAMAARSYNRKKKLLAGRS